MTPIPSSSRTPLAPSNNFAAEPTSSIVMAATSVLNNIPTSATSSPSSSATVVKLVEKPYLAMSIPPDPSIMEILWSNQIFQGVFWSYSENPDHVILHCIYFDHSVFPPKTAYTIKRLEFPVDYKGIIYHDNREFKSTRQLEAYLRGKSDNGIGIEANLPPQLPSAIVKLLENEPVSSSSEFPAAARPYVSNIQLKEMSLTEFCESYHDSRLEDYLAAVAQQGDAFYCNFVGHLLSTNMYGCMNESTKTRINKIFKDLPKEELEAFLFKITQSSRRTDLGKFFYFICSNVEFLLENAPTYLLQSLKNDIKLLFDGTPHVKLFHDNFVIFFKIFAMLDNRDGLQPLLLKLFSSIAFEGVTNAFVPKESFVEWFLDSDFFQNSSAEFQNGCFSAFITNITHYNVLYAIVHMLRKGKSGNNPYFDGALQHWCSDKLSQLAKVLISRPELARLFAERINDEGLGDGKIIRNTILKMHRELALTLAKSGLKFEADDFISPDKKPLKINLKLYEFIKNQFPENYNELYFANFMTVRSLINLIENGKVQIRDIPRNFLLNYLNKHVETNGRMNELPLERLVTFFYDHQIPFDYEGSVPDILIIQTLRNGRVDDANELYARTSTRPDPAQLINECNTVQALSALLQTNFVQRSHCIDYLKTAIQNDNFEALVLFGNPEIISLLTNLKDFDPSMILRGGVRIFPLLDVAQRIGIDPSSFIYELFVGTSKNPSSAGEQMKTRLAEMFVLNPVQDIEDAVSQFVAHRISPELLTIIREEIAIFKQIGTLVARSRRNDFYTGITNVYHNGSLDPSSESNFTKFAKRQVAYGKSLLDNVNTTPQELTLFQCYHNFLNLTRGKAFRTGTLTTPINKRYLPFIDDVLRIHQGPQSEEIIKEKDSMILNQPFHKNSITFTVASPDHPGNKIRLTTIGSTYTYKGGSVQFHPLGFEHTSMFSIQKLSPHHLANYERLKQSRKIHSEQDFNTLIDSIADFVWLNSHLCFTDAGNAQVTMNVMNHLFKIHGVEVGPTRIDVTFIDCKALSNPRERFVKDFSTYFEWSPRLKFSK